MLSYKVWQCMIRDKGNRLSSEF